MNRVSDFNNVIQIGKIVAAHGIRGAVKVYSFAESMDLYGRGSSLLLELPDGRRVVCRVKWVQQAHRQTLRLAFEDVADRNRAEELVGAGIFIDKAALPPLDDDTHYWFELLGLPVYTSDGQLLGKIEQIIATGSNDVYVVKNDRRPSDEILIPVLKKVVRQIDVQGRKVVVELPEGLV